MKKSVAANHLRVYMIGLQKYRSNTAEAIPDLTDEMKAKNWPWVFGDRCPIPSLQKILDHYDKTDELAPMDYYNIRTIMYRFTPEVVTAANLLAGELVLPLDPPTARLIVCGWDPED